MISRRITVYLALSLTLACAPKEDAAPPDTDPAIAELKQAVAADSMSWETHARLSDELRRKNRMEEAAQAAQKAFMVAPSPGTEARLTMAKVYAAADKSASAINIVKEVEKKKRDSNEPADEVKIAEVYAVLGDVSAVFRWLDRAVAANSPNLATLKTNSEFNVVHDDPRWASITAKLP
jgi:tetratricopeptide (TPR) repeat protein